MAWYDRLLGSVGLERKSYKLEEKPTAVAHGASWSNAYGNKPTYSQLGSLAVYAQHPYVFSALSRLSQDLAATPIKLIKGKGKNATIIDEHPILDLLQQPSTDVDAFSFLEQIIIDITACGNCYILLLGLNDQPDSIVRLHPEQIEIITDQMGIKAYRYNAEGEVVDYPPERIIHGKNASWATGVQGLYGVGCIQPIAEEVMSDLNINRLVGQASAKGRPDVILSPSSELDVWDRDTRQQILEQYNGLAKSGGALVTSGQITATFTQLTPRDVEFQAAREYARSAITSALGVPASVLGENSANYATARQQAISYWSTLAKRGKRISHLLSIVAQKWESDFRIEFDYSGVEALNSMRTDQLERIKLHIENGMSPADAYAYEGLEDAPIVATDKREPEAADVGDEEDESARSFFLKILEDETTEETEPDSIFHFESLEHIFDLSVKTTKAKDDALAKYGSLKEAFDALPDKTQNALTKKATEHNEEVNDAKSKSTTPLKLAGVYWRGIGAYKTNPESVRPTVNSAEQWAMGRVNSFLYALRNGRFRSGKHDQDLLPKDHPMASDEKTKAVGDRDPTNFPQDMDNKEVSLSNSEHPVFDPDYAEELKLNYPQIWSAGGNIEGNNQFRRLYPIAKRSNKKATTRTEEMAIRKREAWIARHFEDGRQFEDSELSPNLSNVAGIVAQIKWLAVGTLGQRKMKSIIDELKIKLDEKQKLKRTNRWNMWIKAKQEPAEKILKKASTRYLEGAAKRYASRIRKNVKTKAIIDLSELQSLEEERREIFNTIGGAWQRVWSLVGTSELENVFRIARKEKPIDVQFSSRDIMLEYISQLEKRMSDTTAEAVKLSVQNGLIEGLSVNEIANNIVKISAFSDARANLIARTESTRAVNAATVAAYNEAMQQGINLQKEWLSSADDKVRETHEKLDGAVVGVNDNFVTSDGNEGIAPASFDVPSEDCNCRCTIIPVVL